MNFQVNAKSLINKKFIFSNEIIFLDIDKNYEMNDVVKTIQHLKQENGKMPSIQEVKDWMVQNLSY